MIILIWGFCFFWDFQKEFFFSLIKQWWHGGENHFSIFPRISIKRKMQQMWIIIYPIRMRRKFYRYYFEIYFRLTFIVEKNFISCLPLNIPSILETELIERRSELKPPRLSFRTLLNRLLINFDLRVVRSYRSRKYHLIFFTNDFWNHHFQYE